MGDLEWQRNLYRHPHRQRLIIATLATYGPKKHSKCNMIFIVLAFVFSRLLFGDHSYYVGPGKAFPNSIPGLTSTSKMQFVTGIVGEVDGQWKIARRHHRRKTCLPGWWSVYQSRSCLFTLSWFQSRKEYLWKTCVFYSRWRRDWDRCSLYWERT